MRWGTAFIVLIALASLSLAAACDRTEEGAGDPARRETTHTVGHLAAYKGSEAPADTPWRLGSLNGRDAAGGSDITLFFLKGELGVEGGCLGFDLYHELEGDRLRTVELGLQVGRLNCNKPEAVQRQAEEVLGIVKDLARLEISKNRLEVRDTAGNLAFSCLPSRRR